MTTQDELIATNRALSLENFTLKVELEKANVRIIELYEVNRVLRETKDQPTPEDLWTKDGEHF